MANGPSVDIVADRTQEFRMAFKTSAMQAIKKACIDTEAKAKLNIRDQNAVDTGTAMNSIHSVLPGMSGHTQAVSKAKAAASKPGRHSKKPLANPQFFPENHVDELEGVVACAAAHGELIEEGTASMEARPFMEPAAREVEKSFDQVVEAMANKNMPKD